MSKIKNKKIYDIALAVGGSLYPDVGGELLEKFAEAIIKEAAEVGNRASILSYPEIGYKIKRHFGVD